MVRLSGETFFRFAGRIIQWFRDAVPALFLVDRSFTARWAHADPDYKVRPKTLQVPAAIDKLGSK